MISMAKNERGIRLASAAILMSPIACLIFLNSHSAILDLLVFILYSVFASIALIAFLCEKAEEDECENEKEN